jgi:hypothetical protein
MTAFIQPASWQPLIGSKSLALGILLFSLLSVPALRAETHTVAGHTIRFQAPPGYCLLERDRVVGKAVFNMLEEMVGEEIVPVAVYVDCDELNTLVTTGRYSSFHVGLLALPKSWGEVVVRTEGTRRDEIDHVAQRFDQLDIATINAAMQQHAQEHGYMMAELKDKRFISRDDFAAYAALMTAAGDKTPPSIAVLAMSQTNHLPFSNIIAAPISDPNVLNTLLDAQRSFLAELIDENETAEEKRLQSVPTPGVLDDLPSLLAGYGSIAIGGIFILAVVLLVFRMRRS